MKKVVLIATGGTIASAWNEKEGDVRASIPGESLIEKISPYLTDISLEIENFSNIGSHRMTLENVFRLAKCAEKHLMREDVCGVVITHGTDTMEESAYMADLVASSEKPVVFTGAQYSADQPDSDGPRNLYTAILVAASPHAAGLGVLLVFDGEIHAAKFVKKIHSSQLHAFDSPGHGKLGFIDGDEICIQQRPAVIRKYKVDGIESKIDIIKLAIGMDGRFVQCAINSGTKAIVIEAFGRGNVPPAVFSVIKAAVKDNILVVITTRCEQGGVRPIYGDGGGKDLERIGVVFAGDMPAIKVRILLSVILMITQNKDEISKAIHEALDSESLMSTLHAE